MHKRVRPRVAMIGAVPPPFIGPTCATVVLLESELKDTFELIHIDTSDKRDANFLGRVDLRNVWLALKSYANLFMCLVRNRPDLVYLPVCQTTAGYLRDSVYIWLSRAFSCRVVCHLRGGNFRAWLESCHPATRAYVKFTHRRVQGQIVLGDCLRDLFTGYTKPDRVHVVPNGKDFHVCASNDKQSQSVRVLYLGNMIKSKGALDVLFACEKIGHGRGIEFVFAGAWRGESFRAEVEEFIEARPELPITWLGEVTGAEKERVFGDADIFVFPTYYPPEGHPWVVVEAMAAGLPVIATDQGAIRESVIDGVTGYIVDKRNPDQVARRIQLLAGDADLRARMGVHGRSRYLEEFTAQRMVRRMTATFRDVIARGT